MCFFFNDTATTEIYTLSLHDALPISHERAEARARVARDRRPPARRRRARDRGGGRRTRTVDGGRRRSRPDRDADRKSTRLNSSHANISYAVFCLKKTKLPTHEQQTTR